MRSMMKSGIVMKGVVCGAAALLVAGCSGSNGTVIGPTPQSSVSPVGSPPAAAPSSVLHAAPAAQSAHSLAAVTSWTEPTAFPMQTPTATLAALTTSPVSLLILSRSVSSAVMGTAASAKALAAIQENGQRRVLCHVSLSSITPANSLWQANWVDSNGKLTSSAPPWLEQSNPQRPDVYPVRFWNSAWQKSVTAAVQAAVATSYDGACLGGVGAYRPALKRHKSAGVDMATFVEALSAAARQQNPRFSILPEGGARLPSVLPASAAQTYLNTIDGILAQNVFYPGSKPSNNPLGPKTKELAALTLYKKAGKPVFVAENLTDSAKVSDFLTRAHSMGFIPEAAFQPPAAPVKTSEPNPKTL